MDEQTELFSNKALKEMIVRTFSAVVITVLCFHKKNDVRYARKWIFQ